MSKFQIGQRVRIIPGTTKPQFKADEGKHGTIHSLCPTPADVPTDFAMVFLSLYSGGEWYGIEIDGQGIKRSDGCDNVYAVHSLEPINDQPAATEGKEEISKELDSWLVGLFEEVKKRPVN